MPNLGNSTGGVNSLRLRLAAKPPPSKRGRQGERSMTAPTRATHLFVGEAFRLPQTGRETRPLRGQRTEGFVIARPIGPWRPSASREEVPLGCNLPVQLCGYISTDGEVTFCREIPTDGTAVLGMTCFYPVAPISAYSALKVQGGSRPSPTRESHLRQCVGDDDHIVPKRLSTLEKEKHGRKIPPVQRFMPFCIRC